MTTIQQRAQYASRRAILRGELIKEPCQECGEIRVEAHHPDYDHPLLVEWLCRPHHGRREHINHGNSKTMPELRRAIKLFGSREAVAHEIGVGGQTVYRWQRGQPIPLLKLKLLRLLLEQAQAVPRA